MNTNQMTRLISLAGLGCLLALPTALCYAQDGGYYYGGLSVGKTRAEIDAARITSGLQAAGLATSTMTVDESNSAYKLFAGYQFNRGLALEAGYFNLGRFGFKSTTIPAGTLDGQIKLQGVNLDLVGSLPLGERFSLLGRVGAQYAKTRDNFRTSGSVVMLNLNPTRNEANIKVGVGVQYAFSRNFMMRAEAERYRVNDAVGNHGDVNMFSVGLVFPFGRAPAAMPRVAAAPAYVPTAPAPVMAPPPPIAAAPVVVAVVPAPAPVRPPPPPRRVSLSADSLFTFDRSEIRPEGKAALDAMAQDLKGAQFESITVEGHTDRLGTERYNQSLSERRAQTVKAHLVGVDGISASKVSAVGKGETTPVTRLQDCPGNRPDARLIACLQPDRRVVVEVTATKPSQ